MKTLGTVLTVVLLSGVASARWAADVSGTWNLEMKWSIDSKSTGVLYLQAGWRQNCPALWRD
jgi:hypothetical protein